MKQTQLLKGVLDGCVLAILARHESYGYELMQALHEYGFTSIVGGTLYPLLAKLEKQGDVTSTIKPSPDGPDRNYLTLTAHGRESLAEFQAQWHQIQSQVSRVMGEKKDDA
ncbi:PadR family transcriptional regulator [Lacticaseibacillus mingshuiensis]|uniref:PadR family transcriptional regulator n=1 Tax=Lacticaseibacillus mingshuiensis TaxID=2799574 RepID=UPI00194E0C90|nr:PadR family transcriptional regulator [Lacticaseibacillus mingshuiensis]